MEISEDVRQAARTVLDKYLPSHSRWCRNHYTAPMRRVCLWQGIDQLSDASLKLALYTAVAEVIREQYPKFGIPLFAQRPGRNEATITSFNDDWTIHYADIRRVLEKVAAG